MRSDRFGLRIAFSLTVEYATRFDWAMNTAGTFSAPARLRPSCVSPQLKAPSPKKVSATRGCSGA